MILEEGDVIVYNARNGMIVVLVDENSDAYIYADKKCLMKKSKKIDKLVKEIREKAAIKKAKEWNVIPNLSIMNKLKEE